MSSQPVKAEPVVVATSNQPAAPSFVATRTAGIVGAPTVEPRVNFDNRAWPDCFPDNFIGLFFWLCLFVQVGGALYCMFDSDIEGQSIESHAVTCSDLVPGSTKTALYVDFKMSKKIETDLCKCHDVLPAGTLPGGRRLDARKDWTMYTFFDKKPYVPIIMMIIVLLISAGWVLLLRHFAKPITLITVAIQITVLGTVGGLFAFKYEAGGMGWPIMILAFVLLAYSVVRRQQLLNAGDFMQQASKALQKNFSVFCVLFPLQLLFTLFLFLIYEMWLGVFGKRTVDMYDATSNPFGTCNIVFDPSNTDLAQTTTTLLLWLTYFITHAKTQVVAMTISCWCFRQDTDHLANVPSKALLIALTKSSPVLAVSSLIVALTEDLRRRASNKLNWLNPFCCCLNIFAFVVAQMVKAYGRFAVIYHAITGASFCTSAKLSFDMLRRNLEGALTTTFAGQSVVEFGAYAFSCAVGFGAWAWFDHEMDFSTLDPKGWSENSETVFWIFLILFFILNRYPMLTIFIINILSEHMKGEVAGPITGIFVASVAHLIFDFVGGIILHAVDTVFVCYAINKENRTHLHVADPDVGKVYYLLEAPPEQGGLAMGHVALPVGQANVVMQPTMATQV
jgi:hypothetical protein